MNCFVCLGIERFNVCFIVKGTYPSTGELYLSNNDTREKQISFLYD